MSSLGTARQLHQATGIPVSTINLYARQGALTPAGRVRTGSRWATRYDGRELLRVAGERAATRRNVART